MNGKETEGVWHTQILIWECDGGCTTSVLNVVVIIHQSVFRLTRISSAGLVVKWTRDEVQKVSRSGQAGSGSIPGRPGSITMVHLQAAFFLLAVGFLVAFLSFLLEVIFFQRCNRVSVTILEDGEEKKFTSSENKTEITVPPSDKYLPEPTAA